MLRRAWESLQSLTTCRSLVALYRGRCVAHLGLVNTAARPEQTRPGRMAGQVTASGKASFLANLARYPGECFWCCSLIPLQSSVLCYEVDYSISCGGWFTKGPLA